MSGTPRITQAMKCDEYKFPLVEHLFYKTHIFSQHSTLYNSFLRSAGQSMRDLRCVPSFRQKYISAAGHDELPTVLLAR
jgi:hypothetical protein